MALGLLYLLWAWALYRFHHSHTCGHVCTPPRWLNERCPPYSSTSQSVLYLLLHVLRHFLQNHHLLPTTSVLRSSTVQRHRLYGSSIAPIFSCPASRSATFVPQQQTEIRCDLLLSSNLYGSRLACLKYSGCHCLGKK